TLEQTGLLFTALLHDVRLLLVGVAHLHDTRLALFVAPHLHGVGLALVIAPRLHGMRLALLASAHLDRARLLLLAALPLHRLTLHREAVASSAVLNGDALTRLHPRSGKARAAMIGLDSRPATVALARCGECATAAAAVRCASSAALGVLSASVSATMSAVRSRRGGGSNRERCNAGDEHDLRHD
ncbi:MAG TPA: hypothetical protein VFX31_14775, partial [Ktedonobacterales bacterium]|nr:hypothetical protein [Ktedonobacterales bacterium]